jgi:P-type conjugative transfer protein TrbG
MNNLFLGLIMLSFLLSGCAGSQAKMDINNDEPLVQLPVDDTQAQNQSPDDQSVDFEDISLNQQQKIHMLTDRAEIEKETAQFINKGQADIITRPDGTFVFPYGLSAPTLKTRKMMYSKIVLEEGEKVVSAAAGDTTRWEVLPRYIGDENNYTPVILVKPYFGGLETSLSIITNKRDYDIVICSVDSGEYMQRMAFYYPQDVADSIGVGLPPGSSDAQASPIPKINIENIKHDFVLRGDKRLNWFPKDVFEDGQKVFIKMSPTVSRAELPVFMAIDQTGQTEVVNYRYFRPYFVIDTLFIRGILVLGTDKYRKVIQIYKQ